VEAAVAHPSQPLSFEGRVALAVGLALFVGGMAVAIWRATDRLLLPRLILTVGTAVLVVLVTGVAPLFNLVIALIGVVLIAALEQRAASPIAAAQSHQR
jgi:hypothetical protein